MSRPLQEAKNGRPTYRGSRSDDVLVWYHPEEDAWEFELDLAYLDIHLTGRGSIHATTSAAALEDATDALVVVEGAPECRPRISPLARPGWRPGCATCGGGDADGPSNVEATPARRGGHQDWPPMIAELRALTEQCANSLANM